jgi:alkylated DNA repair dioxygenase AlkB
MVFLQPNLFGDASPDLPEGMRYGEEVISASLEKKLVDFIATLPLKPFEFVGGLKGNRKVVSFGFKYDWSSHRLEVADPMPPLILDLREEVAPFTGIASCKLQQVLVTVYAPGAGIGWHKDRPHFDDVVGVSLLSPCLFRLRRKAGAKWERKSFKAQPRSAYLLSGASRSGWEHSIPPLKELRYSVTFRSFDR